MVVPIDPEEDEPEDLAEQVGDDEAKGGETGAFRHP